MARRPAITQQHRRVFLKALAEGKARAVAAREAHPELTGTAFRGLEHRDSRFAALVQAAVVEGGLQRIDRIDSTLDALAFDTEKPNLRALELMAATHHPDYLWLRRGGGTATAVESGLDGVVDPDLLTREQLALLIDLIKMGQGLLPNPELRRELEAPAEVIDAEEVA